MIPITFSSIYDPSTYQTSSNTTSPAIVTQYVYEFVRNRLINNNIIDSSITNDCKPITYDELFYILLVSKGVFWDYIISSNICEANGLTRSDVKVAMFSEVFYSNKKGMAWKKYAPYFDLSFPSVYALINHMKFNISHIDQEPSEWVSGEITKLESSLFWEILQRLYKKRYCVVNIHDAIVVLDVKGNSNCTEDEVCDIIRQVYWENGLLANIGVDPYGKEHALECIDRERMIKGMTETYLNEQKEKTEQGDKESINFLN